MKRLLSLVLLLNVLLSFGTMIDSLQSGANNGIIEKHCYGNNPTNCAQYGGLYQWDEMMQYVTTPAARGICPLGWHIPTYTEILTSSSAVDGDGNALKAIGEGTGDGAGTNTSSFSALLAGARSYTGYFSNLGGSTYFWSSTEISAMNAYGLGLYSGNSVVSLGYANKGYGFSVRCVED